MNIYHYHPETGEFTGVGMADESPLEPGVWIVPGHATMAEPPVPVAGQVRRFVSGSWEYSAATVEDPPLDPEYEPALEEVKAGKLAAINAGKNAALDGGFLHDGTLFDSDYKARLAYLELALKLGQNPTYSTGWKASSGNWVTMDAALFAALQPTYEAHIQACFAWQAAREMEVAAAETVEEVEAVSEVM